MGMLNKWEIRNLCNRDYWVGAIRESNNYGKFEVIGYTNSSNVKIRFLETGYEKTVAIYNVKKGNIGDPLYNNTKFKGKVYSSNNYGDFEIVDYIKSSKIKVRFLDTGYEMYTQYNSILEGTVRDRYSPVYFGVGYLGEGGLPTITNGY